MIPLRDSIPARGLPVVTWALIGLNVCVFVFEMLLGPELESFVRIWGFVPARYFLMADVVPFDWTTRYLPLVTCMFLHGGVLHLGSNMLYLWIFGDNVEDRLGHVRYLLFYLLAGVAAGLAHAYLNPGSIVPTVGASGAISGVLGGYLVLFPRARVLTLFVLLLFFVQVVEVPAALYLAFWFLMQLVSGTASLALAEDGSGGVAWWAHVGGFVVGMALAPLIRRRGPPQLWHDEYATR